MSRWIRVRDVTQTLFHGKNRSHGPLCCLLTLLGVLVHLEVDNSSNYEVILNLVRGQVIVARPESPHNDLTTSLFLRQLGDVIVEDDIMTVLVFACNVCPDSEQNITLTSANMENILASLISLRRPFVCIFLVSSDLSRTELGVHVHEFKDLRTHFVIFLELNASQHLNVLVTPIKFRLIIHGLSLAKFVLHRADNVLRDLAHLYSRFEIGIVCLSPLCDESIQVCLPVNVWQRIASQSFCLKPTNQLLSKKFKS